MAGIADASMSLHAGIVFKVATDETGERFVTTQKYENPNGSPITKANDWPHVKRQVVV
jgi:hypothetical protein